MENFPILFLTKINKMLEIILMLQEKAQPSRLPVCKKRKRL